MGKYFLPSETHADRSKHRLADILIDESGVVLPYEYRVTMAMKRTAKRVDRGVCFES